jgi:hypothetical protein
VLLREEELVAVSGKAMELANDNSAIYLHKLKNALRRLKIYPDNSDEKSFLGNVDDSILEYLIEGIITKSLTEEEQFEIFFGIFPDALQRTDLDHVAVLPFIRKELLEKPESSAATKKLAVPATNHANDIVKTPTSAISPAAPVITSSIISTTAVKSRFVEGSSDGSVGGASSSWSNSFRTTPPPLSSLAADVQAVLAKYDISYDECELDDVILSYLTESLPELGLIDPSGNESKELLLSYLPFLAEGDKLELIVPELISLFRSKVVGEADAVSTTVNVNDGEETAESGRCEPEDGSNVSDENKAPKLTENEKQLAALFPSFSTDMIQYVYRQKCVKNLSLSATELGMVRECNHSILQLVCFACPL